MSPLWALLSLAACQQPTVDRPVGALVLEGLGAFEVRQLSPNTSEAVSKPIEPGMSWDEMVVSWEGRYGADAWIDVLVRPILEGREAPWYRMGRWSAAKSGFDAPHAMRTSFNGQKDAWGEVQTDTLVLARPATRFEVSLRATTLEGADSDPLRLHERLTISLRRRGAGIQERAPNWDAWGKTLDVPRRFQMDYPRGDVICSPTATAMVMTYWAQTQREPRWDKTVPEVVEGVFDPGYQGTGNWAFNTAFAAYHGLRASVLRLSDVRDLEDLIASGIPVVCSVRNTVLREKPPPPGDDGHLVVLVGFTAEGEPVFNDPGRREVRQVYGRDALQRAWAPSGKTIYLIHPPNWKRPKLSVDF